MVFYFILFCFMDVSCHHCLKNDVYSELKMSTSMDFTLPIKHMNDYHFERLNKMPFLILHLIYHIKTIIIRQLITYINVYTII